MKAKFFLSALFLSLLAHAEVELPRFKKISGNIYRSGRPNKEALEWLKDSYHMKSIINLENSEYYVEREKEWAEEMDLNFYSLPMSATKDPNDNTVNEALRLLSDNSLHPIIIHCTHGRDRTGMVVGLHRVENEDWEAELAYDEMKDLGFRTWFWKLDNYYKARSGLERIIEQLFVAAQ